MMEEECVTHFKILSYHQPGGTEKNISQESKFLE
jgi:hypothetical protein